MADWFFRGISDESDDVKLPRKERQSIQVLHVDRLNELETIDSRPLPPWRTDAFTEIELERDREKSARERADCVRDTSEIVVYSDASGRKDHLGAAIVALNGHEEVIESQKVQVGPMESTEVQAKNITLRLQWIPGHYENVGNDAADRRAKEAAQPGKTHSFRPLLSRENAFVRSRIYDQWGQEWKTSTKGAHLRKIDGDLPARYTRKLYGNLPRNRAYLLAQLRTGHTWLSSYRKKIG
ncbi:reverse transcriptase [Penicillium verhagenii]|uniref:reverse transcriptase n=1 Tax=Penicillium verhagenii TaxID=1562060 RepID=UPI0025456211|nr:reverse transcriptase [Penicillium verhagenii]KAJ5936528.1 reverse transcriptase [Penicillium verhagenii]